MAWDKEELATIVTCALCSGLIAQVDAIIAEKKRTSIPFASLARACEKEMDEETKILQVTQAIATAKGYKYDNYFILGLVEYYL